MGFRHCHHIHSMRGAICYHNNKSAASEMLVPWVMVFFVFSWKVIRINHIDFRSSGPSHNDKWGDLGLIGVLIFLIFVIWGRFGWCFGWFLRFGIDLGNDFADFCDFCVSLRWILFIFGRFYISKIIHNKKKISQSYLESFWRL